jgi:hypothetical protein
MKYFVVWLFWMIRKYLRIFKNIYSANLQYKRRKMFIQLIVGCQFTYCFRVILFGSIAM